MASQFGWMDHDETQRRRMLAAIQVFADESTVDELGFGAVRDSVAGALFPGVSVLHTRARYLLLVPWCLNDAARRQLDPAASIVELRRLEVRLIYALLATESRGVIGQQARDKVKRLPSASYWSVLRRWGIRQSDTTIEGFFRDARLMHRSVRAQPTPEDPGAAFESCPVGLDPNLPEPGADYLSRTSFTLSVEESSYLHDRLRIATAGSLIPWLLDVGLGNDAVDIWDHPSIDQAPAVLAALVEHGRRFSLLAHGAALLYNLMLAEVIEDERDLQQTYRDALDEWTSDLARMQALHIWDREEFWAALRRYNPGLGRPTERFFEAWLQRLRESPGPADDSDARALVRDRELALKGGRARLVNAAARDGWTGGSGLGRLDYNWPVARRLLDDVLHPAMVD